MTHTHIHTHTHTHTHKPPSEEIPPRQYHGITTALSWHYAGITTVLRWNYLLMHTAMHSEALSGSLFIIVKEEHSCGTVQTGWFALLGKAHIGSRHVILGTLEKQLHLQRYSYIPYVSFLRAIWSPTLISALIFFCKLS